MPASKSSGASPRSRGRGGGLAPHVFWFAFSLAVMAVAVRYVWRGGWTLYYGDAEAHLNIARRLFDSRTPGWLQIGTGWLPGPHVLIAPFVKSDYLWATGLGGAIAMGLCTAFASLLLFAALVKIFGSVTAATIGAAAYLLNPNILYLGSIPMSEPMMSLCLMGALYFTVRYRESKSTGALLGAALLCAAGSMARYEGWVLLPLVALMVWGGKRWGAAFAFCVIAGSAAVVWLAHNRYFFHNALEFYNGRYSAVAIQGDTPYPGLHDWRTAIRYYLEDVRLLAGLPALALGAIGVLFAILRGKWWPVLLLLATPVFIMLSVHNGGTPMYMPTLWPFSFYNTRYGAPMIPLLALGVAAIVAHMDTWDKRWRNSFALLALCAMSWPVLRHPGEPPVTWKESKVNSDSRREWTHAAALYLMAHAGPHETFFSSFGDLTGIYREAGIPLRRNLNETVVPEYNMACWKPAVFLHEDWAIVQGGDEVQAVIDRARLRGPKYDLRTRIVVKGSPVLEIYHLKEPPPEEPPPLP